MRWVFHAYQPHNQHRVWGYGHYDNQTWEYLGKWNPKAGTLELTWTIHPREGLLKAISKVEAMSLSQMTTDDISRHIPNYLNKLEGNFLFAQVLTKPPVVA